MVRTCSEVHPEYDIYHPEGHEDDIETVDFFTDLLRAYEE